jgi:predicted transcriptional regulator
LINLDKISTSARLSPENVVSVEMREKATTRKHIDILLFSHYCVEKSDYDACCSKRKLYMLTALYHLVKRGGWKSTKEVEGFFRIGKARVLEALEKLFTLNIVEKRYVPGYRGVMALWRVREDALNGLDKEQVLNTLKKHIEMCLTSTESSKKLSTTATTTANVVIELPGGSSIVLSFSEYRELIAIVNGFKGSRNELIQRLSSKLKQAFEALYRLGAIYYDPSIGALRVSLLRLSQVVKVYQAPYKP